MKTLLALLVLGISTHAVAAERKPTRSECIAGARLLWNDNESELARETILRQMYGVYWKDMPSEGASIQQQERIYFMFRQDCPQKDEMIGVIMQRLQSAIPGFPDYELIGGPIMPSAKETIDVIGDHWSDSPPLPPGLRQ